MFLFESHKQYFDLSNNKIIQDCWTNIIIIYIDDIMVKICLLMRIYSSGHDNLDPI